MRSKRRWIVGLAVVFVLAVPRESDAWFNWIHEMSGPGPFKGVFVGCRSELGAKNADDTKKDFRLCDAGVFTGVGLFQDQTAVPVKKPAWFLRLEYGIRWGNREVPDERTRVIWNAFEGLVEREWSVTSNTRWYSGWGGQ